eukprot:6177323-Pleurochrysis_carterae.AAC.2
MLPTRSSSPKGWLVAADAKVSEERGGGAVCASMMCAGRFVGSSRERRIRFSEFPQYSLELSSEISMQEYATNIQTNMQESSDTRHKQDTEHERGSVCVLPHGRIFASGAARASGKERV